MTYGCNLSYDVYFVHRRTGERCNLGAGNPWRAGFNYLISQPSFGSVIINDTGVCCPDCVPIEGEFDLVFDDIETETEPFEAWRGPVVFVGEEDNRLVINARDPSWWAWNARRWSRDRNVLGVDAARLLAETLREAEAQGDPTGIVEYVVEDVGIESDLIAADLSPLSDQLGLQTAVARYTYIGDSRILVGDIEGFATEVTLLPSHWDGGAPTLARSLERVASEVVVTNPTSSIVGVWPPRTASVQEAFDSIGSVRTVFIEVVDLQTEVQAVAIARAQWARLQTPFQVSSPSGVTLNSTFPVPRRDLLPGLTVRADQIGACLPQTDAVVQITQVDVEISNGIEESVEIDVSASQIAT